MNNLITSKCMKLNSTPKPKTTAWKPRERKWSRRARLSYRRANGNTWENDGVRQISLFISQFLYIACLRTQNRTVSQRSRDINEATSRVLMTFNAPLAAFPGFFTRGCVLGNHRKPKLSRRLSRKAAPLRYTAPRRPNAKSSSLTAVIFAAIVVVNVSRHLPRE